MAPGEWPLQPSHPSSFPLPAVPAVAPCGHRSEDRCSHVGWGGAAAALARWWLLLCLHLQDSSFQLGRHWSGCGFWPQTRELRKGAKD